MSAMEIIVQLAPDVIRSLVEHKQPPHQTAIEQILQTFSASLVALHPGSGEPSLNRSFTVNLPDNTRAEELVRQLRGLTGVEAAYAKPAGEPP